MPISNSNIREKKPKKPKYSNIRIFVTIPKLNSGKNRRPKSPAVCSLPTMFRKQEGHDGPVSLHWLIREIHSYQTLHYLGIGLKHKTPYKD